MDWSIASDIATTISTLVFVVSIVFIWLQLRQQTKLIKVANAHSMTNLVMNFNMEILRDKNLAALWRNGRRDYKKYDDATKEQYESLLSWWLLLYENVAYLAKQGMFDTDFLASWDRDFASFVKNQLLKGFWEEKRAFYSNDFGARIDKIMAQSQDGSKDSGVHAGNRSK
jgi:hypothetical protein